MFYKGKPCRIDVRSDRGSFGGVLMFESWDSICPTVISTEEFEQHRRKLRSFCESTATGCKVNRAALQGQSQLPNCTAIEIVAKKLREIIDMYTLENDSDSTVIRLSGILRNNNDMREHKVFATVIPDR